MLVVLGAGQWRDDNTLLYDRINPFDQLLFTEKQLWASMNKVISAIGTQHNTKGDYTLA